MGLKEYREFKKNKMRENFIMSFLSSLDISIDDLKNIKKSIVTISSLKIEIKDLKEEINKLNAIISTNTEITDSEKKDIENYNKTHTSIEEIVKSYQGQSQEFYPYGKPVEKKDN